jgi:sugar phosphate isomerase/epimerase
MRIHAHLLALAVAPFAVMACRSAPSASASASMSPTSENAPVVRLQGGAKPPLGLELYTFRVLAKEDPVKMLHTVRRLGFTHVEGGGTYGMPLAQYAQVLNDAGLRTTSILADYKLFKEHPDSVVAEAKALGATYAGIAWYPHEGTFTEADARRAIADFNAFGRAMKDAGLTFVYHNHGYEAEPYGDGTLLDLIIRETDPELVKFEMDVLWTWYPGLDPVALLEKYPGRFKLMHLKDMQPGIPRGSHGLLPEDKQAALGEGQVPWAAVLAAAAKSGVEHYYIEDETPAPLVNVPKSVRFLEALKY